VIDEIVEINLSNLDTNRIFGGIAYVLASERMRSIALDSDSETVDTFRVLQSWPYRIIELASRKSVFEHFLVAVRDELSDMGGVYDMPFFCS
jgi:hypothetical protein